MSTSDRRAKEARRLADDLVEATRTMAEAWWRWSTAAYRLGLALAVFLLIAPTTVQLWLILPWTPWTSVFTLTAFSATSLLILWIASSQLRHFRWHRREYFFLAEAQRDAYQNASGFEEHITPLGVPSFAYRKLRWALSWAVEFIPERMFALPISHTFQHPHWYETEFSTLSLMEDEHE